MWKTRNKASFYGALFILVTTGSANAEVVQWSKLDRQTEVYIQRGHNASNVDCFYYALDLIRNGGRVKKSEIYIEFDTDDDSLGVSVDDSGEAYTCKGGVLRSWDAGDSMIVKKF